MDMALDSIIKKQRTNTRNHNKKQKINRNKQIDGMRGITTTSADSSNVTLNDKKPKKLRVRNQRSFKPRTINPPMVASKLPKRNNNNNARPEKLTILISNDGNRTTTGAQRVLQNPVKKNNVKPRVASTRTVSVKNQINNSSPNTNMTLDQRFSARPPLRQ
eukprot:TRINITY_DN1652_c0_g1_i1.p1 TRINITY_DN1652_c0_g1~~TRINITY_DN1652_c0_g1_i1.p1  ORF type:complete len:180 (+),score=28.04 TRINITY_DN1652_c0_g1_i1:59-541(+)